MKTLSFLTMVLTICCNSVFGQITTEIYTSKGDVFKKYPELTLVDKTKIPQVEMPYFDNNELFKEDEANKGKNLPFKFGKSTEVNLSIKDGTWIKTNSRSIWSLIIYSKSAYSINIILSELFLPKNSHLFLYDADGTMVYGPITSDFNFENEAFLCDIIRGEYLIISIISPNEDIPKVKLGIKNVVHGYRNLFPSQSKSSGSCNNNVECFTDWKIESNAVARLLLTGGTSLCSGSLINNTSSTFHPYFLTAFHCVDLGGDGVLQQSEIDDVYDMSFRFDYKYTTCGGSTVASYVTFNHATFRSAWYTTDFALIELSSGSVNTTSGITLLGWNRTGNTPSEGVCIHHPSGDVMKISFDDDNLTETSYWSDSGTNFWRVIWDDGVTETGSSGSPLLDQNKRIIGQLKGGPSGCESENMRDWYGCFYRSWVGGGTNTTRLSNWLDPGGAGVTTLNSAGTLTGPNVICSSGAWLTIEDFSGDTISWSCDPDLTRVSDQGSNPCLFQANSDGSAWIEATVTYNSVEYDLVRKDVWAGNPYTPDEIYPIDWGPYCPNEYYRFGEDDSYPIEVTFSWGVYGDAYLASGQGSSSVEVYTTQTGSFYLTVSAENICGYSSNRYSDNYDVTYYCREGEFVLYPNPADDNIKIELKEEPSGPAVLEIYNSQLIKLVSTTINSKEKTIDISKLPKGLYYVNVLSKGKVNTERFIKQ